MEQFDSNEFRKQIFESSLIPVVVMDAKTYQYIYCNPAAVRVYRYPSREATIGKTPLDVSAAIQYDGTPSAEKADFYIKKALKDGSVTFEWKHQRPNGEIWDAEVHLLSFMNENRKLLQFSIVDITERKNIEMALRMREKQLAESQRIAHIGSWEHNYATGGLFWSEEMFRLLALDPKKTPVDFKAFFQMIHPDDQPALEKSIDTALQQHIPFSIEYRCILKDGAVRILHTHAEVIPDESGNPVILSGTMQDITDRKKAEEAHITERKQTEELLMNAQKLESLGVLAGGIAHDFNNLLTGIFANIDLARSVSKDVRTTEYLEATLASMNRARALTQQLLTFAKGGAPVQKITPLIPFIEETAKFALSGSNVLCRISLAENLWSCNIDKNQIGQVINNIVINAQQAMPSSGSIEIAATNISFREKEHPSLAKGDYVKVSIKDHGIGIPKYILPRIFDPFFTTKTKGHGLGLATCYSIINRHGGCIDVESEPGAGSTFHVYLPASSATAVADAVAVITHKGSGTIIVVDDEEAVRLALLEMLTFMGYSVVCKSDGREALDFYVRETRAGRLFAAMLLDLTVRGGLGGIETVAEIRKLNREIPVFVVSGYADNAAIKNPVKYGFTASISKPFTIAELSEMLNNYLKPHK